MMLNKATPGTWSIAIALAVIFSAKSIAVGATPREALLDDNWKFHKGDLQGEEATAFADADWRTVQLPHDWGIEGPFSQEWASGQGFLPGGIGWYRKSFDLPADSAGKHIAIRFDGVYKHSQVWCNGKLVGGRPYGYMTFTLDLTPFIQVGAKNELAVKVDHSDFADARWYTGSGIFRDVHLITTDPVHVVPHGHVHHHRHPAGQRPQYHRHRPNHPAK